MIKQVIDRYYVKAVAKEPWPLSSELTEKEVIHKRIQMVKDLEDEIKRHCDSFSSVTYDLDYHWECTFCGREMAHKKDYECCEESVAEHDGM